jgi:hypothetical protein
MHNHAGVGGHASSGQLTFQCRERRESRELLHVSDLKAVRPRASVVPVRAWDTRTCIIQRGQGHPRERSPRGSHTRVCAGEGAARSRRERNRCPVCREEVLMIRRAPRCAHEPHRSAATEVVLLPSSTTRADGKRRLQPSGSSAHARMVRRGSRASCTCSHCLETRRKQRETAGRHFSMSMITCSSSGGRLAHLPSSSSILCACDFK